MKRKVLNLLLLTMCAALLAGCGARGGDNTSVTAEAPSSAMIVLPTGENISPAELEAHFYELPLVQDCQVFADKNELGAEILAMQDLSVLPPEVLIEE